MRSILFKIRIAYMVALVGAAPCANGQAVNLLEVTHGVGTKNSASAVSYQRAVLNGAELMGPFTVSAGLKSRFVHLVASKRKYQTAGTTERTNHFETLTVAKTKHTAFNQGFFAELGLREFPIFVGFNLDLVGYTLNEQNTADSRELDGGGVNIFRWAYNDLGTLHSETYVGALLGPCSIKAGTSHSSTEYRIKNKDPTYRTQRFLNFSDTVFVSVGYLF